MDLAFVMRLGVLLVRPGALIAAAPPFGGMYTPVTVKIGLTVILAVVMAPIVPLSDGFGGAGLVVVIGREMLIGLALALAVRLLLAGAELAGQLAGFQLGFAYAATVDPQTGARNNVVASIYANLALISFVGINAHHALLRTLTRSYGVLPVGIGHVDGDMAAIVMRMLGAVFVIGAQLAAPVVIVLLIVELAMGLLTRSVPSLNIMVIGFPVRLLAGLLALGAAIAAVPALVKSTAPHLAELALALAQAFK
jgi:flagellar biosynthesis protein FliR